MRAVSKRWRTRKCHESTTLYSGYLFFQLNQTSTEIIVAIFRACICLVILQKAVHNRFFLLRQEHISALCAYCTISFNSAGPVTRDGPAEILVSATSQNRRDKPKFWEFFGSLAPQATNFFMNLSHDHQMNSAPNKNYRDYRDISGFWRAP
jgi:hypothetical protein